MVSLEIQEPLDHRDQQVDPVLQDLRDQRVRLALQVILDLLDQWALQPQIQRKEVLVHQDHQA